MATNLSATVTGGINYSYTKSDTLNAVSEALSMNTANSYAFGKGSSKAEIIYRARVTVTTGSPNQDITLYGVLADVFGDDVDIEVLRGIYIHNRSTTAGDNIYVGPLGVSNPLLGPWIDADGNNKVGPGGTLLLDNPLDGYALENDADTIRIQYQGTSGSIDVDVCFLGNEGDFVSSSSSSTSSSSSKSVSSSSTSSTNSNSSSSTSSSTSSKSTRSSSSSQSASKSSSSTSNSSSSESSVEA